MPGSGRWAEAQGGRRQKAGAGQGGKGLPSRDREGVLHPEGNGEPLETLKLTNSKIRLAIWEKKSLCL